ncbi:MAG: D-glycerate dehydrogenase [Armatimonadota bacterium]|nr:MAG: D-glycerate dehydrogenase [Armatimonadota bacterium]
MSRVYVTRAIADEALASIRAEAEVELWPDPDAPPPREVLLREVRAVDGLLCLLTDAIDAEVIEAGEGLRVISNYAVGHDNVDVACATARGILVCNTPGVLTETTADLAWALLMAAARRVVEADGYLRAGRWRSWSPQLMLGQDVQGATLGIVGFGRIGQAVARRARGFEMRILYSDIARKPEAEEAVGAEFVDLRALLRASDFVSVHTPLTEETHHLIGAEELALMKPTAVLINTARGPVVDGGALAEALRERRIFGAGLDVFESEPPAPDDALLKLDNIVVLPHIASASVATRTRMAMMAAENLLAGLRGESPPHIVNPEAL